ncbi:MAG: hypothetical protein JJU37_09385 [Balneolaceae bacterium]|nr:hypothetical protein [Balneolaceae bacterium]
MRLAAVQLLLEFAVHDFSNIASDRRVMVKWAFVSTGRKIRFKHSDKTAAVRFAFITICSFIGCCSTPYPEP